MESIQDVAQRVGEQKRPTLGIFSVYDSKAEVYMTPFFERTRGTAERVFASAVNNAEHEFHKHAEDYSLWELGWFSDSGYVEAVIAVELCRALHLVNVE